MLTYCTFLIKILLLCGKALKRRHSHDGIEARIMVVELCDLLNTYFYKRAPGRPCLQRDLPLPRRRRLRNRSVVFDSSEKSNLLSRMECP